MTSATNKVQNTDDLIFGRYFHENDAQINKSLNFDRIILIVGLLTGSSTFDSVRVYSGQGFKYIDPMGNFHLGSCRYVINFPKLSEEVTDPKSKNFGKFHITHVNGNACPELDHDISDNETFKKLAAAFRESFGK
jgi:hypothetical protein